jgi:succinate dehydrogenase/fumarate reductase iron-sulfur protein
MDMQATTPAGRDVVPRSRSITVRVQRSGGEQEFTVEARDPVTVLDLLRQIQWFHEPALAFRYSCRVAMCGTCGIRANGRSVLACQTVVPPETDTIAIGPLSGLPVVRDLIVDMRPFWAQWADVTPWFVPRDDDVGRVDAESADGQLVDSALGCISCGACYSTCDLTRHDGDYLGPAALNRALALIADSRDGAGPERLALVGARGGVDRCHYVGACTTACPAGLDPSRSIVELRRRRAKARV